MELGHLLTRFGLTYPEVSSKVCHDSFCQSGISVSLPWVIYCEAFYLHVVYIFSCIPVICPILVVFFTPLQFVYLFCNLSQCILLLFSCISSLLLLFFCRPYLVLRGILFTRCIQFILYSSNLSKIGVIFNSFAICVFVL